MECEGVVKQLIEKVKRGETLDKVIERNANVVTLYIGNKDLPM